MFSPESYHRQKHVLWERRVVLIKQQSAVAFFIDLLGEEQTCFDYL
jgi:hypothetical protein